MDADVRPIPSGPSRDIVDERVLITDQRAGRRAEHNVDVEMLADIGGVVDLHDHLILVRTSISFLHQAQPF